MQNMSSVRVCASKVHLVCMWDAWPMHEQGTHKAKCVKHATNNQNMINIDNHGNPQKLVLIRVQNNKKIPFGHFNNAWTYKNLA